MNVQIKVSEVNSQRLAKLQRELGYLDSRDFLRTIPLAAERRTVEEYMESISPRGDNVSKTTLWLAERGIKPLLPKFATGWRVKRVSVGNRIVWQISHILETTNRIGGQVKFRSIEFGSRTEVWSAKRDFKFLDANGRWHSFSEDDEITHWGNPPANIIEKTSEFIRTVMLPQIASKVRNIVEHRLERVTV